MNSHTERSSRNNNNNQPLPRLTHSTRIHGITVIPTNSISSVDIRFSPRLIRLPFLKPITSKASPIIQRPAPLQRAGRTGSLPLYPRVPAVFVRRGAMNRSEGSLCVLGFTPIQLVRGFLVGRILFCVHSVVLFVIGAKTGRRG